MRLEFIWREAKLFNNELNNQQDYATGSTSIGDIFFYDITGSGIQTFFLCGSTFLTVLFLSVTWACEDGWVSWLVVTIHILLHLIITHMFYQYV